MESSFDHHEDGVESFGLVGDPRVSESGNGVVIASDERISGVLENGGNVMRLNGEDNPNLGTNLVGSGLDTKVSEVGELHAVNLVVDLRHCSTKEANDVEFAEKDLARASFKPVNIIQCMQDLAKDPFEITRSEISVMEAQLSSFKCWKGYYQLHINLDDKFDCGLSPSKKMKCLSDLMSKGSPSLSEVEYTPKKRGRKRKNIEFKRDEFLSLVRYFARNPIEKHHTLESVVRFSSDFRNYRIETKSQLKEETEIQPEVNSATALILKFTDLESVPSLKKMNEIFGHYGSLQEHETQVLKKKRCVKMVFERRCDAETAFSSSGKFSIFGPALLSYCLNFSPTPRKRGTGGRNLNKKKGMKSVKKGLKFED